jgi:hypothetical protein
VRRLLPALVLALLPLVGGCGGDPVDEYCAQVRADREKLADMTSDEASGAALLEQLPLLRTLADKAPRDLADEWQTFLNAVQNLDEALREAKVDPEAFKAGKPPPGTSAAQLQAIREAATQMGDPDVVQAVRAIEQQARDVCKVNVGI